jgi:carbonic anhydrase/acetyltransferase-like protein (isoleucine patch superfamily)
MFGAAISSEGSAIEIGECAIICENAVIRASAVGDREYPVKLGDHVFVSPHATLIGCTVERCSYIATGATVLQGAVVRPGAAVAVGAFVHAGTVVPAGAFIPPNAVAVGDPADVFGPDQKEELAEAIKNLGFARIAFGVEAGWEDRLTRYERATEIRSREFEKHFEDVIAGDA